jgi:hypothetical protein
MMIALAGLTKHEQERSVVKDSLVMGILEARHQPWPSRRPDSVNSCAFLDEAEPVWPSPAMPTSRRRDACEGRAARAARGPSPRGSKSGGTRPPRPRSESRRECRAFLRPLLAPAEFLAVGQSDLPPQYRHRERTILEWRITRRSNRTFKGQYVGTGTMICIHLVAISQS